MTVTADFCCGAECVVGGAGATPAPDARHFQLIGGGAFSISSSGRNGGKAWRFAPVAGETYVQKLVASHTKRWFRYYIKFLTLPTANTSFWRLNLAAGNNFFLRYRQATQDMILTQGVSGTTGATAVAVVTGVWYLVEIKCDVSANPRTAFWRVDSVDKGSVSSAAAATTSTQYRIGSSAESETTTCDLLIDDFLTGTDITQYPVGPGEIVGLKVSRDGTHSFNTAGDFIYNAAGGNIPTNATDVYTYLSHDLSAISTFINGANPAAGEYIELGFQPLGEADAIHGVEVVSAHHAAGTAANLQTGRLHDGATDSDVFTDADFSNTTITTNSKHYATAPSTGTAWTRALINALLFRWGSSWTTPDVSPAPYLDSVMLEVAYIPLTITATGSTTESGEAASGAGKLTAIGAGATTESGEAAAGVGVKAFIGAGVTTESGENVAGVGTEVFKATGATVESGEAAAGVGKEVFTSAGATVESGEAAAGVGVERFTGAGVTVESGEAAAGTGKEVFTGAGATVESGEASAGVGKEVLTGQGVTTESGEAAAGAGVQAFKGAGVTVESGEASAGAAAQRFSGAGVTVESGEAAAGTGKEIFIGAGVTVESGEAAAGHVGQAIIAAGVTVESGEAAAGTGRLVFIGAGATTSAGASGLAQLRLVFIAIGMTKESGESAHGSGQTVAAAVPRVSPLSAVLLGTGRLEVWLTESGVREARLISTGILQADVLPVEA